MFQNLYNVELTIQKTHLGRKLNESFSVHRLVQISELASSSSPLCSPSSQGTEGSLNRLGREDERFEGLHV